MNKIGSCGIIVSFDRRSTRPRQKQQYKHQVIHEIVANSWVFKYNHVNAFLTIFRCQNARFLVGGWALTEALPVFHLNCIVIQGVPNKSGVLHSSLNFGKNIKQ